MKLSILAAMLMLGLFSVPTVQAQAELNAQQKLDALKNQGAFQTAPADPGSDATDSAMLAQAIAQALGVPAGNQPLSGSFADVAGVPGGEGFRQATQAALESQARQAREGTLGGAPGTGGGADGAAPSMTLEQLAAIMVRMLGLPEAGNAEVPGQVSDWAAGYVAAAIQAGLIAPGADYTRPASAREQFLAMSQSAGRLPPPADPAVLPDQERIKQATQRMIQRQQQMADELQRIEQQARQQLAAARQSQTEKQDELVRRLQEFQRRQQAMLNNPANDLRNDDLLRQAVDRQMPVTGAGAFTGEFSGISGPDMGSFNVGGTLSLSGDFSQAAGITGGRAVITQGGSGAIDLGGFGPFGVGEFTNTASISHDAKLNDGGDAWAVTDMNITGVVFGTGAEGGWHMQGAGLQLGSGSFHVSQ